MKNLFNSINVTTTSKMAPQGCSGITHAEANGFDFDIDAIVCEALNINPSHDIEDFCDGVDVIQNALNHSHPGETVYFWVD